jgi:hypothetical protein
MRKQTLLLIIGMGCAASARAAIGDPFVGEVATSWATTNAVTATAGTVNEFDGDFWPVNMVNGYAFAAAVGPTTKPAYEGAPYNSDGVHHSYSVTSTGWLAHKDHPSGLPHPSARATTNNNNYAQNWISFAFDKPYTIVNFEIWNGSYGGGPGGGGDFSFRDVYIDYKVDGVWQMAANTTRLSRVPDIFDFFVATDTVTVGLDKVTQVVITPINSWAEDTSWYPIPTAPSASVKACVSEIRFYIPAAPPSISVAAHGADVTIAWAVDIADYVLESSSTPTGGTWTPVDNVVNNSVTITNASGSQFYRLKK